MSSVPRAKKSLGQHFLKNDAVCERIVRMADLTPHDRVVEIGPGPGALTTHIRAVHPCECLLIEKDNHWAAHHAALPAESPLRVLHDDALAFAWESLQGPWKVLGNLPYNVASPLMWDIVARVPMLVRAVFMIQKEVGQRLAATPGGRDYGALSVWIQSHVRVEWGFVVGPGSFAPPPKVDSAVVAFAPLNAPHAFNAVALKKTLSMCFQQRRKQLQSLLRHNGFANAVDVLENLHIPPSARPETLFPQQFHRLSEALYPNTATANTCEQ